MRWDELFDDLAGQARAAADFDLRAEVDERVRDQLGRRTLLDRLAVLPSATPVELLFAARERVSGVVAEVGDGWLRLADGRGEVVVPSASVAGLLVRPAERRSPRDGGPVRSRLGLRPVLRELVRRRCYVQIGTTDGGQLGGTLDSVGADHLELAEHPRDRPRRDADVRALLLLPFAAVGWLRPEGS